VSLYVAISCGVVVFLPGVVGVGVLAADSQPTNNYTLLSHLRLCSLFVASYDSQGLRWKYSSPPPHWAQALSDFLLF
jgi:hypothetical protein